MGYESYETNCHSGNKGDRLSFLRPHSYESQSPETPHPKPEAPGVDPKPEA